jgi:hypothetical protein
VVAAVIQGLVLWLNGRRQEEARKDDRAREERLKQADRDHEERLRRMQLDHEARLDYYADRRRMRDVKLERVRAALKILVAASTKASGAASGLVHGPANDRERYTGDLVEVMETMNESVADIAVDAESQALADKIRKLVWDAGVVYRSQQQIVEEGAAQGRQVNQQRMDRMEEFAEQILRFANELAPAAREMLAELEAPIGHEDRSSADNDTASAVERISEEVRSARMQPHRGTPPPSARP